MADAKHTYSWLSVEDCPTPPEGVLVAASRMLEQQHAVRDATAKLARTPPNGRLYQELALLYERRLSDALENRAALREEIRLFGGNLRQRGVRPEHVVPCVRVAMDTAARTRCLAVEEPLLRDVVTWAIQGYYAPQ